MKLKREQWLSDLPDLDPEHLVFIDESGAKTNMTRYRCGDYQGIGKKTLEAYSNDLRGHYAIHARAVLKEK